MSTSLSAFSDELTELNKEAGVTKSVARKAIKHPLHTLGALAIALPTAAAGVSGYRRGKRLGKPARYLKASRYGPSSAFWTNWSRLLTRKKMKPHELRRLSEHHRERAMRR